MTIHSPPPHHQLNDFACMENLAARALQAGRRAADGLGRLDLGPATLGRRLGHLASLLASERLFEALGLEEVGELESELHVLVERESYHVPAYGSHDAEEEIRPDRRLTDVGLALERVRSDVAEALRLARYVLDLAAAEQVVGRARGLLPAS